MDKCCKPPPDTGTFQFVHTPHEINKKYPGFTIQRAADGTFFLFNPSTGSYKDMTSEEQAVLREQLMDQASIWFNGMCCNFPNCTQIVACPAWRRAPARWPVVRPLPPGAPGALLTI